MAPVMSMRCITVPPRMNPSGFESFGRTTCTVSEAESCQRLAFTRTSPRSESATGDLISCLRHPQLAAIEVQRYAVWAEELVPDNAADLEAEQDAWRLQV